MKAEVHHLTLTISQNKGLSENFVSYALYTSTGFVSSEILPYLPDVPPDAPLGLHRSLCALDVQKDLRKALRGEILMWSPAVWPAFCRKTAVVLLERNRMTINYINPFSGPCVVQHSWSTDELADNLYWILMEDMFPRCLKTNKPGSEESEPGLN